MIPYGEFKRLVVSAPDCASYGVFMAEEGGSVDQDDLWMFLFLWDYGCDSTFKRVLDFMAYSRAEFERAYGVPWRTQQNWLNGVSAPKPYELDLLAYAVLTDKAAQLI